MHKRTLCRKRTGFPFFIERNTEVIIFPHGQWKVRMNETDSDHVVLKNIQRRIKTKIWSAQLSSFNFFFF